VICFARSGDGLVSSVLAWRFIPISALPAVGHDATTIADTTTWSADQQPST
jgi:hypothetical protein